jgi:hypothetical protein
MPTYFGQCDSSGNAIGSADDSSFGVAILLWYASKTFVCPGSGPQVISDLSGYVRNTAGSPLIRVGIYSVAGALIASGSSQVAVSSGSYAWVGHQTATAISPNPATLTGGTAYRLALYFDSTGTCDIQAQPGGSSGDTGYDGNSYATALPGTLPAGTSFADWFVIRCGVNPAFIPAWARGSNRILAPGLY